MKYNTTKRHWSSDNIVSELFDFFESHEKELKLEEAFIYYDFPLYKEYDGKIIKSKVLIISPYHGVVAIGTSDITERISNESKIREADLDLEQVFTHLYLL